MIAQRDGGDGVRGAIHVPVAVAPAGDLVLRHHVQPRLLHQPVDLRCLLGRAGVQHGHKGRFGPGPGIRGQLLQQGGGLLLFQQQGSGRGGQRLAAQQPARPAQGLQSTQGLPVPVAQGDGVFQRLPVRLTAGQLLHGPEEIPALPDVSLLGAEILDHEGVVHVVQPGHGPFRLQPSQLQEIVVQLLDQIRGIGQDQGLRDIAQMPPGHRLKIAAPQGAEGSLQILLRVWARPVPAEQADRGHAAGEDDLLGHVVPQGPDDGFPLCGQTFPGGPGIRKGRPQGLIGPAGRCTASLTQGERLPFSGFFLS